MFMCVQPSNTSILKVFSDKTQFFGRKTISSADFVVGHELKETPFFLLIRCYFFLRHIVTSVPHSQLVSPLHLFASRERALTHISPSRQEPRPSIRPSTVAPHATTCCPAEFVKFSARISSNYHHVFKSGGWCTLLSDN